MSEVDIIYVCKECGWSFSLQRNKGCPMCKTPPDIDEKLIIETLQEYSRRKGIYLKKKEAKLIATNFRKKYGRLPTFKEIWDIAEKIIAQKATGKKLVIKPDKVDEALSKKMAEMKESQVAKAQRKAEIAQQRGVKKVETVQKVEDVKKKEVPAEAPTGTASIEECPSCGHSNPPDSRFCLECGNKLI
ncbi:MAG: zinc ribbon domain-containing protein [Promethearchaeota archaeon]